MELFLFVDPSNPTPDLQSILAYQNSLPVTKNTGGVQLVNDPKQYLQEYTERVRPDLERKVAEVNKQYSNVPKGGTIVRNHDKLYDYYKSGDRLYYRKKGGKNWINISDNEVAQQRINDTIARNQKSYGGNKNATKKEKVPKVTSSKAPETQATPVAQDTTKVSTPTPKKVNNSVPKRVQGASIYKETPISPAKARQRRVNELFYGRNKKNETPNNQSRYSGVDSDYLFKVINPAAQSRNRVERNVNLMQRNQVQIPEATVKDWRYYLNHKPQSQPTGARGAVITTAPSKWRGKYN